MSSALRYATTLGNPTIEINTLNPVTFTLTKTLRHIAAMKQNDRTPSHSKNDD